jgi:hypothetical protein
LLSVAAPIAEVQPRYARHDHKEAGEKMDKGLLLGSVAALIAAAAAHAADTPVPAKPMQYVKICRLYGDGFYYIPGTDTCMKLGGYLRV